MPQHQTGDDCKTKYRVSVAITTIINPPSAQRTETTSASSVQSSDSSSDDSDSGSEPIEAPPSDQDDLPSTTDLEYALLDISHVLKCLYRFSVVLHQPIPLERIQRCASIDVKHYEFWDIGHATNKFPQAPKFLQQRLGRANSKRRQLLIYHERHHKKISQPGHDKEEPQATPARQVELELTPSAPRPVDNMQTVSCPFGNSTRGPRTVFSGTTATTFYPKGNVVLDLNAILEDQESDTAVSQTSYASTYSGGSGLATYNLVVPNPPKGEDAAFDGEPFECPYCHDIISIKSSKSWRYSLCICLNVHTH